MVRDEKVGFKLGELLKRQREMLDMCQGDIARKLGYRNTNYISMLERGLSTIFCLTYGRAFMRF